MRQNRTVVVDFHADLIEYTKRHGNMAWFMEKVLVVMAVAFFSMHKVGCALRHKYTRHGSRSRPIRMLHGQAIPVSIYQIKCMDCGAVFTVLPSMVIRYKRYHVELAAKLLECNLIMDVSYRFQAHLFLDFAPGGPQSTPTALWRLMCWLGRSIGVTDLLLKLGLLPPAALLEDEKFVSEAGYQTYIAAIYSNDLIWFAKYLSSTDEATLAKALSEFKGSARKLLPEYTPDVATLDGHKPAEAAFRTTFPSMKQQACILHAQRNVNHDIATYRHQHPEADQNFLNSISNATWNALNGSFSMAQFSQRLRRIRERVANVPLLAARIDKLFARRHRLMTYLACEAAARSSVALDQGFKLLRRKYFQMQSFMTAIGGQAFSNAFAIARNFWRFMPGAKRAGRSPVEINGVELSCKCWVEIVNICAYGVYAQP